MEEVEGIFCIMILITGEEDIIDMLLTSIKNKVRIRSSSLSFQSNFA